MKTILLFSLLLLATVVFPQVSGETAPAADPFLNSISKMFFLENFSYDAYSANKSLFDLDTVYKEAKVIVKKQKDSIIFLHIIDANQPYELLLYNDSVWQVRHQDKELHYIGNGMANAGGNTLSGHFPVNIFTIDTMIKHADPFWRTISEDELYDWVSIDLATKPEEVSDIKVTLKINKNDSLIYSFVQDVGFKGMTARLFQEENFRNYTFPASDQIEPPACFNTYTRVFPDEASVNIPDDPQQDSVKRDIYLESVELYDLEGNRFSLPQEGLIFIDLWYVGCFPCMKAAPVIEKLYHEYKDNIHFYSVNEVDSDKEKINRFKDMMGISIPILLGGKEKLAFKINNSNAYPAYFLMNAQNGKVLWSFSGFREDLEQLIKEIFDQNL